MNIEEKIALITRNTEEVITIEELRKLLEEKKELRAYIGFEPSGLVHIGWKICVNKINDLTNSGFDVIIFLADWHAYINDKLNGNIENIRICGKYMEDCFFALGINKRKVKFVYASEFINKGEYWEKVLKIGKNSSLARVKRALTIMGRKEDDAEKDTSKLIYPLMQSADIFQLEVDVAYGGIDQRKVHMLTRDVAEKLGWRKPIALHTPLLTGLAVRERMNSIQKDDIIAEFKMSKSSPDSCIYIHDNEEEIKRKIKKAFCPEKVVENPVIDICKYIIFPELENWKKSFVIEREEKFGGNIVFNNFEDLNKEYSEGKIHPVDLKNAVIKYLNYSLISIREYFAKNSENYEKMKRMMRGYGLVGI